jgi:Ca-activated chloride channel family protein
VNSSEQNTSHFYQENLDNKQYGQSMLLPAQSIKQGHFGDQVFDKDILFVIDTSGSMSGSSMNQAKAALQYGVDQLNSNDRFNIIDFSNQAKLFSHKFITANQYSK